MKYNVAALVNRSLTVCEVDFLYDPEKVAYVGLDPNKIPFVLKLADIKDGSDHWVSGNADFQVLASDILGIIRHTPQNYSQRDKLMSIVWARLLSTPPEPDGSIKLSIEIPSPIAKTLTDCP